jgi:hypothetical protein
MLHCDSAGARVSALCLHMPLWRGHLGVPRKANPWAGLRGSVVVGRRSGKNADLDCQQCMLRPELSWGLSFPLPAGVQLPVLLPCSYVQLPCCPAPCLYLHRAARLYACCTLCVGTGHRHGGEANGWMGLDWS